MKKKISLIAAVLFVAQLLGQTQMTLARDLGSVKVWEVIHTSPTQLGKIVLGKAYTIEKNANAEIIFSPDQSDTDNTVMVITGTYTSGDNRVAGTAYENCTQIGNEQDKTFRPNGWLNSTDGTVWLGDKPGCNAIQVYKLIDQGTILDDIIYARTKKVFEWRFFVEKNWTKKHRDGTTENGVDQIIIDFELPLTIKAASDYVKGMERNVSYQDFEFESTVTVALLDTGMFRPFLLNGRNVHGVFPVAQSNVIVIK